MVREEHWIVPSGVEEVIIGGDNEIHGIIAWGLCDVTSKG
jgi:hypothetical protein